MELLGLLPYSKRQKLQRMLQGLGWVSMLAGFILLLMYGFIGAVYVILQSVVFAVGILSLAIVVLAALIGVPFTVQLWRRQHEHAGFATLVVLLAIPWGFALWLMLGELLKALSGQFMVVHLPGS